MLSGRHPWLLIELSCVYSLSDQVSESQKIMDELILRSQSEFIPGMFAAAYFLKDYDKAIELVEQAFSQHDGSLVFSKAWPMSSFIKTDLRFQPYLKRMNFPA